MPYRPMSAEQVRDFLAGDPPHTGKLATVRADGRPHVAPIWYVVDPDGSILFMTGEDTVKGRNLRRTGWASLCVDDERPPFAFVTVEGRVDLADDPDRVRSAAARIGGRYMGAARADEYGERNGVPGELLVRLHPDRITSADGVAE